MGRGVTNPNRGEVALVQRLLNRKLQVPLQPLIENGVVGQDTIQAIEEFQRRVVHMTHPDGRIDPGGAMLLRVDCWFCRRVQSLYRARWGHD